MSSESEFKPIYIVEVIENQVGRPRNDGTRGSALYDVPLRLSARPPGEWATFFVQAFDNPKAFSSMHRPGHVSVMGDTIRFRDTTLEEIAKTHKRVLEAAAQIANEEYVKLLEQQRRGAELRAADDEKHRQHVADEAKKIQFNKPKS